MDEQLTYLFAFVDSLKWIDAEVIEFWLDRMVDAARNIHGKRRDQFIQRLWECVSGELGGNAGIRTFEWWISGGKRKLFLMNPSL